MSLSSEVIQNLKKSVDAACADPKTSIPGTSVVVVGKDGKELFAHAAGKRGVASSENMTLDSVFWIASCTKMIAGLACMQLVEQGKLHLDDGEEMEQLVPELKEIKVLQKDGSLVEKKRKITLRMLLSHTGTSDPYELEVSLLTTENSWLWILVLQRSSARLFRWL
jgi:CubicO group peptidase (beta-lactamase class C family)